MRCRVYAKRKFHAKAYIIYGVKTRSLNRAVKRNPRRFPTEFVFVLQPEEVATLRCQFGTLKPGRGWDSKLSASSESRTRI
jgi:hypothetical protein